MTLFHRWRIGLKTKPEPKQITWVCGDEKVLVEEVVAHIRSYLEPSPWNQTAI